MIRLIMMLFILASIADYITGNVFPAVQELPVISYFFKDEIKERELIAKRKSELAPIIRSTCKRVPKNKEGYSGVACNALDGSWYIFKESDISKEGFMYIGDAIPEGKPTHKISPRKTKRECKKFGTKDHHNSNVKIKSGTVCKDAKGNWKIVSSKYNEGD